jgi:UDP-N-acetylmuramoyl-tripeptide--D-alanyl-D-alanine ligase
MGPQDTIIVNADDPFLSQQADKKSSFKIMTYGIRSRVDVRAFDVHTHGGRNLKFRAGSHAIELNSCGVNNVYNALAAVCCGVFFKIPVKDIAAALKAFEFPQGRGQIVRLGQGWMINDTYNANPVSMKLALQTLQTIETKGNRIFVAADMLELGSHSKVLHEAMGLAIEATGVDVLITVGHFTGQMAAGIKRRNKKIQVFACADAEGAQKCLAKVFQNGDTVLIKGSRRMRMEQVAEFLLASPKGAG